MSVISRMASVKMIYGKLLKHLVKFNLSQLSKGFAFIEMPNAGEAKEAIDQLNGKELKGQNIKVNEARPKSDRNKGRSGGRRF